LGYQVNHVANLYFLREASRISSRNISGQAAAEDVPQTFVAVSRQEHNLIPDTVSYSSHNSITASRAQNIEDLIAVPRPQTHERLESDRVCMA
jgi:hypothetical protein